MSYVYIISEGANGPVKIGMANNPGWRVCELQTGNPRKLRLVDTWAMFTRQEAFDVERLIRDALKDERITGEWYAISEAEALTIVPLFVSNVLFAEEGRQIA